MKRADITPFPKEEKSNDKKTFGRLVYFLRDPKFLKEFYIKKSVII